MLLMDEVDATFGKTSRRARKIAKVMREAVPYLSYCVMFKRIEWFKKDESERDEIDKLISNRFDAFAGRVAACKDERCLTDDWREKLLLECASYLLIHYWKDEEGQS